MDIGPEHHLYDAALQEFQQCYGMDVRQVLLPSMWVVSILGPDEAGVMINEAGVRALALLSPDPTAP